MNLADLKFGVNGFTLIAVRIRVTGKFFCGDAFPPASDGLALMLTWLLPAALAEEGLGKAQVVFFGSATNCQGLVTVSDLESGLTYLRGLFASLLLDRTTIAYWFYDPRELVFRPIGQGNSETLKFDQLQADMQAWLQKRHAAVVAWQENHSR